MKKLQLLLFFFPIANLQVHAQAISEVNSASISNILYQFTDDISPGLAAGIVRDGNIIYEQYIGMANLQHSIKVDSSTRFNIASNAKQFTALCILNLENTGKLNVEEDFRHYLPEIYANIESPITIANLMNHTSGIRDYCDLCALRGKAWWKQFLDNDEAFELIKDQKDLNFVPGTDFVYSNSNYILLAKIIEKITGENFSIYAKKVFEELGMQNTAFRTHYGEVIPEMARPYGYWSAWREEPMITEVHGDGALFTTLRDQLKWEQIVQSSYDSEEASTIKESQNLPNERSISSYGYGLEFREDFGLKYTSHDGVTSAYSATFLRFPSQRVSIVVMSNNRNVPANYIAWQIAQSFMQLKAEENLNAYPSGPKKVVKLNQVSDATGIYEAVTDGTVIKITEKNDTLFREIYGRQTEYLNQEKGGLFIYGDKKFNGLNMNFVNLGKDNQKFTLYRPDIEPTDYKRVSDLNFNGLDKTQVEGVFFNEENKVTIVLEYANGNEFSFIKQGRKREAELISIDYLRTSNGYEIEVLRDKNNNVIGLQVSINRAKNVIFTKL